MPSIDGRFDDLARSLADEGHTRRSALRLGAGIVGGAFAAVFLPRRAAGIPPSQEPSECAIFCQKLPAGPLRGQCISQAQHGTGFCIACGADVTRICGDVTKQVCCNPDADEFCCETGPNCVTCSPPQVFDPTTCTCSCPGGTQYCFEAGCCPPSHPLCKGANPTTHVCVVSCAASPTGVCEFPLVCTPAGCG